MAIATVVEILNLLESTMRTSPPFVLLVAGRSVVRNAKSVEVGPIDPAAVF
jgi:hypothetical protein